MSGTTWLDIQPIGGTLGPAENHAVTLDLDAGELPLGVYRLDIEFHSNDPLHPLVSMPVVMQVENVVMGSVDLDMIAGDNLRSWNVSLPGDGVADVFAPVMGGLESVQGFDGEALIFDPSLPPGFNTLQTVDAMHGSGRLTVRVSSDPDCVVVEIEDDGPGIPEDVLPHVFDPFFTTKPVGDGSGLGLAVAQGMAREHGGWIDVESRVGRGSRFTLFLPV